MYYLYNEKRVVSLRLKDSARCSVYEMLRKMCLQVKRKGSIRLVCVYIEFMTSFTDYFLVNSIPHSWLKGCLSGFNSWL